MSKEEVLKSYIIEKFKSIRQFALQTGLKYPTIVSVLKRGLNNSCIDTVFDICHALDISVDALVYDGIIIEKHTNDKENQMRRLETYWLYFQILSGKEPLTLDEVKLTKEETEMFEDGMEQLMEMIRKKRKRKKSE